MIPFNESHNLSNVEMKIIKNKISEFMEKL